MKRAWNLSKEKERGAYLALECSSLYVPVRYAPGLVTNEDEGIEAAAGNLGQDRLDRNARGVISGTESIRELGDFVGLFKKRNIGGA